MIEIILKKTVRMNGMELTKTIKAVIPEGAVQNPDFIESVMFAVLQRGNWDVTSTTEQVEG